MNIEETEGKLERTIYQNVNLYNSSLSLFGRIKKFDNGRYIVRLPFYNGYYIFRIEDVVEVSNENSIMIKIKDFQ